MIPVLQGVLRGALAQAVSPAVSARTELPATTSAEPAPARRAGQEPFVKEVLLFPLGFMENLLWFLFREQVLQLAALDLTEPLNFIGSWYRNVSSPPNSAERRAGCQMLGTCFHIKLKLKLDICLRLLLDHIFVKPLFKQSPSVWALSREMVVQPYTCLFRVPPWSDFEKNMGVCIIPVELFKNRFTSNLNKSSSILSNPLLPSHLVKCRRSWTGLFSYIMVSQSVALSQEVAVILHHFADVSYKKYKKNYTGPFRQCEVKCRWLKILQIMVLQPKSQLFCIESSFISQFQQRGWREVAALTGSCCPLMGRKKLHSLTRNVARLPLVAVDISCCFPLIPTRHYLTK